MRQTLDIHLEKTSAIWSYFTANSEWFELMLCEVCGWCAGSYRTCRYLECSCTCQNAYICPKHPPCYLNLLSTTVHCLCTERPDPDGPPSRICWRNVNPTHSLQDPALLRMREVCAFCLMSIAKWLTQTRTHIFSSKRPSLSLWYLPLLFSC